MVLCAARPDTVLVHGKEVVRRGELVGHDVDEIAVNQNAESRRLIEKWELVRA